MAQVSASVLEDPWAVGAATFPTAGTMRDKLLFALNYAVLAPSILNTQPWRFRVRGDRVALYADASRLLRVIDPAGRELTISCGAALLNLRVALAGLGYAATVKILPEASDPDRLADVQPNAAGTPTAAERRLREAILARRTGRGAFAERAVPAPLLDELADAAEQEGAQLSFIADDAEAKQRVAALVADAVRVQLADPAFRRELPDWVSARVNEAYERYGAALRGMIEGRGQAGSTPPPIDERTMSVPSAVGAARMFADTEAAAASSRARTEGAPVIALLTTRSDTRADWIAAGQALERALLAATAAGLTACYESQPIEIPDLRPRLATLFASGGIPQMLLRLGYAPASSPPPRRPLRSVIL